MKPDRAAMSVITGRAENLSEECALPRIRVLVVDDQPLFRDGIAQLLSAQADIEVVGSADNLGDAIEQLRATKPDVALVGWLASSPNGQKFFAAHQEAKLHARVIMLV